MAYQPVTDTPRNRSQREFAFRRIAVGVMVSCLQEVRFEDGMRRATEVFGAGAQPLLHRQPWRRPRRPSEPFSVLEAIRRFEVSQRQH